MKSFFDIFDKIQTNYDESLTVKYNFKENEIERSNTMGLFKKKKISLEEEAFQKENQKELENFHMTKAWGVKKYPTSMQFIFDKDQKCFVVVEGPAKTFKEKNPYIIHYDQVKKVSLRVDEYYSEKGDLYAPRIYKQITVEQYKKVYWRYDFYIIIETIHPYAKTIEFQTNFHPTITKVPSRNFMYRRGFEIGGTYSGKDIDKLINKLTALRKTEEKALYNQKVARILRGEHGDTIAEGVKEKLLQDIADDTYLEKIDNITNHVKRAKRISNLLMSKKE